MTQLTEEMFQIFDQPEFSFKKIKMQHSEAEVAELKDEFKGVWQTWKAVNQAVAQNLPTGKLAKVHIKSWTNGWNLRDHYWASYRLQDLADANPCVGVILDKKQLQVYLMFQHIRVKTEKLRLNNITNYWLTFLVGVNKFICKIGIFGMVKCLLNLMIIQN